MGRFGEGIQKKYFPPSKTAKCRHDILSFTQLDYESLYEACERYKDLMRRCPTYEPPKWQQLQTFYLGLQANTKAMIDVAAGGSINKKSVGEAYELIDTMASNDYPERSAPKKEAGIFQVDNNTVMVAQMSLMQQQFSQIVNTINPPMKVCDLCGGAHSSQECRVRNLLPRLNKLII